MLRDFVENRKIRLQDHPAKCVYIFIGWLVCAFLPLFGLTLPMVFTAMLYGEHMEEQEIYRLVPETAEERWRRLLFQAGMELLLLAVPVTVNLLNLHFRCSSVLVNRLPDLFLIECGYFFYLFYHMADRVNRIRESACGTEPQAGGTGRFDIHIDDANTVILKKILREKIGFLGKSYQLLIYLADRVLLGLLDFCALDVLTHGWWILELMESSGREILAGIGVCMVFSAVDLIRGTVQAQKRGET